MSVGEYRLFRQAAGRGWFAQVRVEVLPGEPGAVWSVPPGAADSVQPDRHADLVAAALAGAEQMAAAFGDPGTVHIRQLGVLESDTEESAVRAAAGAATARALGADGEVAFDGERWRAVVNT
jgi:hypothetical protein